MNRFTLRFLLLPLFLTFFSVTLHAQIIPEMAFTNAEIPDILVALSNATGKSIIPDETVHGAATYSFKDELEFEKGLEIFLSTYKLYYRVENNIYYVSRIKTSYDPEKAALTMDAEDVELVYLIRAASKAMNITVMDESLPSGRITVHAKSMKAEDLLGMLLAKFPEYYVEKRQGYFLVRRQAQDRGGGPTGPVLFAESGGKYTLSIQKARFRDLVKSLFLKAGLEYQNFSRKDQILEDLRFSNKTFDEMLRLLLEQMSMDYQHVGNVYYLFEISQRDIMKKYSITSIIPLNNLGIQEFQKLLPSELSSSKLYKFDESNNAVILNGSIEEIGPIREFIKEIDRPNNNLKYYLYTLDYLEAKNIKAVIPPSLRFGEPVVIPNSNSFLALLTEESKPGFDEFIAAADMRPDSHFIRLKYIKSEDLVKTLPPSVVKENIVVTGEPSGIFFAGSEEKYKAFLRELDHMDRPIPQIQYKVLVIQYDRDDGLNTSASSKVKVPEVTDAANETDDFKVGRAIAAVGNFSDILNLSFDIMGNFGFQFGSTLNAKLSDNTARVFIDTTLSGVSGQEIKFQNTETTRFSEVELVPGSTTTTTTKTIEVSSGLIINVKGWISGDGMISMDVNATVSEQSQGEGTNALPRTSEKVVNSHVRTRSGDPLIIGGLIYQKVTKDITKVPVLGDIPLLGLLFQSHNEKVKNVEMVIYLVPVLQYEKAGQEVRALAMERYYTLFILPAMQTSR